MRDDDNDEYKHVEKQWWDKKNPWTFIVVLQHDDFYFFITRHDRKYKNPRKTELQDKIYIKIS